MFDTGVRLVGVMFMLLSVVLVSWWLTVLTAPRPLAKLPSAPTAQPENTLKMVGKLFGVGETRSISLDGLQLAGVFAGSSGGGFATFRTRSGAISVFTGGEIEPGVRLKQIEGDRVIILSAGVQRELRLSEAGGQPASTGQAGAIPQPQVASEPPRGAESNHQAYSKRRANRPQEEEQ